MKQVQKWVVVGGDEDRSRERILVTLEEPLEVFANSSLTRKAHFVRQSASLVITAYQILYWPCEREYVT